MNNDKSDKNNIIGYNSKNAMINQKHFNQLQGKGKKKKQESQIKFLMKMIKERNREIKRLKENIIK